MDNQFNPEIVLYDFSLQTGDTLTINNMVNSPLHPTGVYRVDSIFNFNLILLIILFISSSVKCSMAASQTTLSNTPSGISFLISQSLNSTLLALLYVLACCIAAISKSTEIIALALTE